MGTKLVNLGFAEDIPENEISLSCYMMPCKVGGKPTWLDLKLIPSPEQLKCGSCKKPCIFLCQIYAPVEEDTNCFHRTIFIFLCKNELCCTENTTENIIVFRSQLPQKNEFYVPNIENIEDNGFNYWKSKGLLPTPEKYKISLCSVCGCRGPFSCSKCRKVKYCGKEHQQTDWGSHHKIECGKEIDESNSMNKILYPKFEIIIQTEEKELVQVIDSDDDNDDDEEEEDTEEVKVKTEEYNNFIKSHKFDENLKEEELEKFAMSENDKNFSYFKKRIAPYPDQIIRYDRKGEPLWITSKNKLPINEVPNCEYCGSNRVFEFQIMPQMLVTLKENNLDWGIICVYTCEKNCKPENMGYMKEFCYKQDIVKD